MQTFQRVRRSAVALLAVLTVMACAGRPAFAQPPAAPPPVTPPPAVSDPIIPVTMQRMELQVTERFSKVLQFQNRVTRVDGFDPEVVNVTALAPSQLRMQALRSGVTTIVVVDELNEVFTLDVFVLGDVRQLQLTLSRMFPDAALKVVPVRDTVVLRGWVTQPESVEQIIDITRRFYPEPINQMRVGGVQQVQLNVKIMEIQRSKIRQLGINFLYGGGKGAFGLTPGQVVQLGNLGASASNPNSIGAVAGTLADPSFAGAIFSGSSVFNGFVDALKREGLLKILAEPKLVTTNGRPAHMLAGGEFPILVPQNFNVTIQWKQFGVKLEAVPFILGNGRLRLQLQPEVSERDFTSAVTVSGLIVPGLTTRRVNTEVEMAFGETLMLAGMLSTRKTAQTSKLPYLGDMPWIGAAFRKVEYRESETELVILVTPELVAPVDCFQLPPGGPGLFTDDPTDSELYKDGLIEVPYFGDHCPDGCEVGPHGMPLMPAVPQPLPGLLPPQGGLPIAPPPAPVPAMPVPALDGAYPPAAPFPAVPSLPGTIEPAPPMPTPTDEAEDMTWLNLPPQGNPAGSMPTSGTAQSAVYTQTSPAATPARSSPSAQEPSWDLIEPAPATPQR